MSKKEENEKNKLKETLAALLQNMQNAESRLSKIEKELQHINMDVMAWGKVKKCLVNALIEPESDIANLGSVNSPIKRLK